MIVTPRRTGRLARITAAAVAAFALIAGSAVAASASAVETEEPDGIHSITGTVYDPEGAPLEGARVAAWIEGEGGGGGIGRAAAEYASAVTDADGRYTLTGLAAGDWLVRTDTWELPADLNLLDVFYGDALDYDDATPLVIPDGPAHAASGIDLRVQQGGQVSGIVAEADRGSIHWVTLRAPGDPYSTGGEVSKDTGAFVVHRVAPGTYSIFTYLDGGSELLIGGPVTVAAGAHVQLDVELALPPLASLIVANSLDGESGRVDVLDAATDGVLTTMWLYGDEEQTRLLLPGQVVLKHTADDGGIVTYYDGATDRADATVVTLSADKPAYVYLGAGDGAISGTVTDEAGAPLVGRDVQLFRADNQDAPRRTTTTDATGAYSFAGLAPNNYAVKATGGTTFYIDTWFGGDGTRENATAIELGEGAIFDAADITLPFGGGVSGSFDLPDGVDRVTVYLDGATVHSGTTVYRPADGPWEWEITGIVPGTYRLSYYVPGGRDVVGEEVVIRPGEITAAATLVAEASITGLVTTGSGDPVSYGGVTAHWYEANEWGGWWGSTGAQTTSDGRYAFIGLDAGRDYYLEFEGPGGETVWWDGADSRETATPVTAPAAGEDPVRVDVVLGDVPPVSVSGRVFDAVTGGPVWSSITAYPLGGGRYIYGYPDAEGKFTLELPRPGAYELVAAASENHRSPVG